MEILLDPGYQPEAMDWQLKRTKKKKKRKRLSPE
jgi:1-aminocyclopropane-1-carboxylate deaminase/D-cysteine desulfhydrase-like pyridoxal-dependent ACC family enzyme